MAPSDRFSLMFVLLFWVVFQYTCQGRLEGPTFRKLQALQVQREQGVAPGQGKTWLKLYCSTRQLGRIPHE